MRIGCLGNMNNNLFAVARYLRDRGLDAELCLLEGEFEHFHPSADTFDEGWRGFTRQLPWGGEWSFARTSGRAVRRDLGRYDALVACHTAPAFAHRAGRRVDLFAPYGADILFFPFFRWRARVNPLYEAVRRSIAGHQAAAIREARAAHDNNELFERCYDRLGTAARRLRFGVPMLYLPDCRPEALAAHAPRSRRLAPFRRLREEHDFVVFHHARHVWESCADGISWKGNDRLLRGFALFRERRPEVRACLVTFEYGGDVAASRRLCADLGIAGAVRWFPLMERREILLALGLADLGTGEFHRSWLSGGTMYETLALGKPLLHYREDALYRDRYPELYPHFNAREPEEIAAALESCAADPAAARAMGERGRAWLEEYVIRRPLAEYERLFSPAGPGKP